MRRRRSRHGWTGGAFLAPALSFLLLLTAFPLLYSLWASFTNLRLTSPVWQYVGFAGYLQTLANGVFRHSLQVTIVFLFAAVAAEFVLGFALALSFKAMRRNHPLLRALLMLPVMATPVSVGLVWKLMLNDDFGIIPHVSEVMGFGRMQWLSDPNMAVFSIILMDIWQWTPFMFLILLAGLEGLPPDLFEAAEIDGAKRHHVFFGITLPLMARIVVVVLTFRVMFAIATFDSVFVLTKGGPALATDLVTLFIQREGLVNLNVASASAASFLVLILVFAAARAFFKKGFAHGY